MSDKNKKNAWIDVIPEDEASAAVGRAYKRSADQKSGKVDHIMKIHSLNPQSLIDHLHLYKTLMHAESPLSKAQREMIGVVVSEINRCEYWLKHHARNLRQLTDNRELVDQIENDYRTAALNNADKAMLDYAAKLTRTPWDMVEDDVIQLRELGFDDRSILDIAQVTAYYAYVNRIADGLGVSLEDYWADGKEDYD